MLAAWTQKAVQHDRSKGSCFLIDWILGFHERDKRLVLFLANKEIPWFHGWGTDGVLCLGKYRNDK